MTIQEYIEQDNPFFHLTPLSNLNSILEHGLRPGTGRYGICVVRSDNESVLSEIIDTQLNTGLPNGTNFALIKIVPSIHGIYAEDVSEDPIDEPSAPLYNYILHTIPNITTNDIVRRDLTIGRFGQIDETVVVCRLESYLVQPPHIVNI